MKADKSRRKKQMKSTKSTSQKPPSKDSANLPECNPGGDDPKPGEICEMK